MFHFRFFARFARESVFANACGLAIVFVAIFTCAAVLAFNVLNLARLDATVGAFVAFLALTCGIWVARR